MKNIEIAIERESKERERELQRQRDDKTKNNKIRFKEHKDINECVGRKTEYYNYKWKVFT